MYKEEKCGNAEIKRKCMTIVDVGYLLLHYIVCLFGFFLNVPLQFAQQYVQTESNIKYNDVCCLIPVILVN